MNGADQDVTSQVTADRELGEASRRLSLLRDVAEVANKSTALTEAMVRTAEVIAVTPGWYLTSALMASEQDAVVEVLSSADAKEGALSFLEQRPPKFTGR